VLHASIRARIEDGFPARVAPADPKRRASVVSEHLQDLGVPRALTELVAPDHETIAGLDANGGSGRA
jgi:hypothetical protein